MSASLDRALMELSLHEEELPFQMPDSPEFSSCEWNSLSIIGRVLNPQFQKMADLIMDMPRKWQKADKIRGVALSKERFQFIFDNEYDLVEILGNGFHTFNEWALAVERWKEKPTDDFLQYIEVWVQILNIPVNSYTVQAINALGELVGRVVEVAFDPTKSQRREYVRVKVSIHVAKPLSKSKVVIMPSGESIMIEYHYERVQKRCFTCQRLIHDQENCPLFKRNAKEPRRNYSKDKDKNHGQNIQFPHVMSQSDHLFGVLKESQVGINPGG